MHGGSGVSEADYKKAIAAGIRKINYYTYMNSAAGESVKEALMTSQQDELFFDRLSIIATAAIKKNVMEALKIFNGLN